MQILVIFACQDLYSYDGFCSHRNMVEGDYSLNDLAHTKRDYLASFTAKRFSKISVIHMEVSPEGTITVLDSVQGEHPLKTRIEINPAAVKARAARKEVKPKNTYPAFFDEVDAT